MANILVVDDDKEIRDLLKIILSNEKHNVIIAGDGQDGLFVYKTQPLDLIITDMIMPNKDGIELIIEVVGSKYNKVPIIAMSGGKRKANPDFHAKHYEKSNSLLDNLGSQLGEFSLNSATNLGVKETLKKPFTSADLIEAVNRALKIN